MAYDPTIYAGSAPHYRAGRPPYSPELEAAIGGIVRVDGTGRLLDAGCGPGILTVRLAPLFAEAVGLDPDADMLTEGRQAATEAGITTITWVQAVAEALPAAAPGPYSMVTFGQSFHWTDEHQVGEAVYEVLEPGGALALIVHTVEGRTPPPSCGPAIPHAEITGIVENYLGTAKRAGQGPAPTRQHRFEDVLVKTRFGGCETVFLPGVANLMRSSESVLAGYLSFSWAAPHLFGDRLQAFEDEVRELLAETSPDGMFWDWPGDTEIVVARKP